MFGFHSHAERPWGSPKAYQQRAISAEPTARPKHVATLFTRPKHVGSPTILPGQARQTAPS
jgi:hypothetical protein